MKVLVLVDLQNDFIDGSLGNEESKAIIPRIVEKLDNYSNKNNTLILFTKDTHHDNYLETYEGQILQVPHCIENTSGWSINKEVSRAVKRNKGFLTCSTSMIINSRIYKDTFGSDVLRDFLLNNADNISEVEFVGVKTDVCVISNVLMTKQALPDKNIIVDASCCAGTTPEKHKAALEVMESCHVFITP